MDAVHQQVGQTRDPSLLSVTNRSPAGPLDCTAAAVYSAPASVMRCGFRLVESIWLLTFAHHAVCRLATVMQHAVLAARTIVTAACPPSERAAVLGYIGASYGVGFAVGPAVGGWLSSISLTATAWAAAAGSLLALLVVLLGLPDGERCRCRAFDVANSSTVLFVHQLTVMSRQQPVLSSLWFGYHTAGCPDIVHTDYAV